jgi:hypothetical protein
MRLKRLLLFVLFLTAVAGYVSREEAVVLALRAGAVLSMTTDDCDQICGPTAECDLTCYNELLVTTCGEYDGGHENDWCDGDTCEDQCSPWVAGNWACWMGGELVTCQDFGDYAECDDGYCAWVDGGETCSNCETDCGPCPPSRTCGQNGCEAGETWRTCPQDCDEPIEDCGDGKCARDEDGDSCPQDCTFSGDLGTPPLTCPEGYVRRNEFCVWNDPAYVCCETTCGGGSMCTVDEVCKPIDTNGDGQVNQSDTKVCVPRWSTG